MSLTLAFMLLAFLPLSTQLKEECVVRLLTGDASTMRKYALFHHLPGRALRLPDVCCTCRANQSNSVTSAVRPLYNFFIMTASLQPDPVVFALLSILLLQSLTKKKERTQ